MLLTIKLIGACAILLAAISSVIAIVLMLLSRIRILFRAFRECGFTLGTIRDDFLAMMADVRARPGRFVLGLTIFCGFVLFAEYVLLGLVALGVLGTLFAVIVRWRGSATNERLVRHLSRPLLHG